MRMQTPRILPAWLSWRNPLIIGGSLFVAGFFWINGPGGHPEALKQRRREQIQYQVAARKPEDSIEKSNGHNTRTPSLKRFSASKGSHPSDRGLEMGPPKRLAQAEEFLRTGRADEALSIAMGALASLQRDGLQTLPALNLLGEIHLELGNADKAREYFLAAADADADGSIPEAQGGGAEKFLWLAQLSEDGGQDSVNWFQRGAVVLRKDIAALGDHAAAKEKEKKLSEALCGIIEVYMTDLSWESDAEAKCESLITEALLVAPHSPEPLQTLASIRISQARIPEAKQALAHSIALWKDLPPEDTGVPAFPTRISLARLLMEVAMEEEALEVVERLVTEDDQSVEAWYLGGWCLYLLGDKQTNTRSAGADADTGGKRQKEGGDDMHISALVSSREWLRQSLALYEVLGYEDDRLRDHARELVDGLDARLGAEDVDSGDEEGVDGEGEGDGDGSTGTEDDGGEDREMDES